MYGSNHPKRIQLNKQIKDWNSNRLDLFEISEPNEYLEFYGVMRFFYQDDDLKYQTKCLRISSAATTLDVIEAIIIKFHPDLKMLSNDRYALYESHNIQERKMKDNEYPLIVQLNWAYDDKDGKFILKNESKRRRSTDSAGQGMLNNYGMSKSTSNLRNINESQTLRSQSSTAYSLSASNFFSKRMLSSKKSRRRNNAEEIQQMTDDNSGPPPESSFTRTISNPDEVMKRRRQRKLEARIEQFSGDNETGGTLKIYGDSINSDIPYKTLLLSVNDTAEKVLTETLDKYGLAQEDHRFYLLVQQNIPSKSERLRGELPEEIILHEQDCPLGILVHCPPKRGNATFAIRRRSPFDKIPVKPRMPPFTNRIKKSQSPGIVRNLTTEANIRKSSESSSSNVHVENVADYPRLVKLIVDTDRNLCNEKEIFSLSSLIKTNQNDAAPIEGSKFIKIGSQLSAVGNPPNIYLPQDYFPDIRPTHCHISSKLDPQTTSMKLSLTPTLDSTSRIPKPCLVYINQQKIDKSTRLQHGDIIQIGDSALFRFDDTPYIENISTNKSSNYVEDEDLVHSVKINYLTADLPVSVKHNYNSSEQLIDKIMDLSKIYAHNGSKDLFSFSADPRFHDLDEIFRLSPAYIFYLVLRSSLGNDKYLSHLTNVVAENIDAVIQEDRDSVEKEVFWLSNSSELLHLLQCDSDLRHFSGHAQDILASAIEQAFTILQSQFSLDLIVLLPSFIDPDDFDLNDDIREDNNPCLHRPSIMVKHGEIDGPIQYLMQTLSLTYILFHNCQINVALTIQMFSQLFHLLNTWLFNTVLGDTSNSDGRIIEPLPVCPEWGARLSRRLSRIKEWSENNGLDVAANCHLQKMYQVTELMEADKKDLNLFGEKCLEFVNINGTQLHFLLENCEDCQLPNAWIEVVVNTAIQWQDQAFNGGVSQNRSEFPLFEDLNLRLPLLLPADGYCCDRGIVSCPKDLRNMLDSLSGLLTYKLNPPTINQVDTRWKTYLGPYENTVSRSGTIVEQSPKISAKQNPLPGLPRNIINDRIDNVQIPQLKSSIVSPKRRYDMQSGNNRSQPLSEISIHSEESEIYKVDLENRYKLKLKKINNSLGLSIISARRSPNDIFRTYVKDVVPGGAAHRNGKIEIGDQLVSVDGTLLENLNQSEAVELIKNAKSNVNLLFERHSARKHGVLDAILKTKKLKMTPRQTQRKPPELPVKHYRVPNKNTISHHSRPPPRRPHSSGHLSQVVIPQKHISKRHSRPPMENSNRKRMNLPAIPQSRNPPPRPPRASKKHHLNGIDSLDKEFHSLPVRNHGTNKQVIPESPTYAKISKPKTPKSIEDSTRYSYQKNFSGLKPSRSQPNLLKKQNDYLGSSKSSSTISLTTSGEDDSIEYKRPVSKSNNLIEKYSAPYEAISEKGNTNKAKVPAQTAFSDYDRISKGRELPRYELSSNTKPKNSANQFITRPAITSNSEPVMKTNLERKSQLTISDSESENLSSFSQSLSDHSPKPQNKINSEPIIQLKMPVPSLTNRTGNPENSFRHNASIHGESPSVGPMRKVKEEPQTQFKMNSNNSNNENNSRKLIHEPNSPMSFSPKIYDRRDKTSTSNRELSKEQSDEEIKMRRKPVEDKSRSQINTIDKKEQDTSSVEDVSNIFMPQSNQNRSSTGRYGRPQFNSNSGGPGQLESSNNIPSLINSSSSPSNKYETLGTHNTYRDHVKKNQDHQSKAPETAEELSFQDKVKLFAQKYGESQVVNRNKFSSKQRKLENTYAN